MLRNAMAYKTSVLLVVNDVRLARGNGGVRDTTFTEFPSIRECVSVFLFILSCAASTGRSATSTVNCSVILRFTTHFSKILQKSVKTP